MFDLTDYTKLNKRFYIHHTLDVAKELLGKYIFKAHKDTYLIGKITETEAYLGKDDNACHASKSRTKRNEIMFNEGGYGYVYFIYGNYFCFNVVTEEENIGSAVLIRAVEPIQGIEFMKKKRNNLSDIPNLTNGPAKFCMAFDIDKRHNGIDLTGDEIFIAAKKYSKPETICVSKRIGITQSADLPYRFFIKNNCYISKHKHNKEILNTVTL